LDQFRFEAVGLDWPVGQTVSQLKALLLVTVTLRMTAVALAGTPLAPAIVRSTRPPGPSLAL